ncbi:hypothetical protein AN6491.2 [Aspergillus nidulans FGSC A4]|nr:hypothetical protein AN6491.2 [Aspergillus nidulans FGSC A4]|eukprot:XP_664095.1 hypothetical protein AN6491.2 [Aspergillus nidulans FGSC A4]
MDILPELSNVQSQDHTELTDDNIQHLLAEAEKRLRNDTVRTANDSVALRQSGQVLPKYVLPKSALMVTLSIIISSTFLFSPQSPTSDMLMIESGKAQPPKYSQVGTIIEGPTEFFSGRIPKRDRKKTFVDEALALEKETRRFETRYNDVQQKKRSGKTAFYKSLVAKRKGRKNRQ